MKQFKLYLIVLVCFSMLSNSFERESSKNNKLKSEKIDNRNKDKYSHTTRMLDGKSGSIYSLAEHEINCIDRFGPIRGFHLWGSWGFISNYLSFEFNCQDDLLKDKKIETKSFESQNKKDKNKISDSPTALIDIDADCKENFLGKFQLINDDKKKQLYFSGQCIKLKQKPRTCETITGGKGTKSSWFLGMGSTVSNLDQIPVNAPENKALVSFKMIKTKDDKIAFEYVACEIDMTDTNLQTNQPSSNPVQEKKRIVRGDQKKMNADVLDFELRKKKF